MYNTKLEGKIDAAVKRWQNIEKKKMFGGVGYLLKGNMCFGIYQDNLIVRMNKEQGEQSLKNRHVQPFGITGKSMTGWVMVKEAGWKSQAGLAKWIEIGKQFVLSLPEKKGKRKKKKTLKEYNA
jgi:TfoX/Sxy family transcriptional regulator of competence genes